MHLPKGLVTYDSLLEQCIKVTSLTLPETVTDLGSRGQNFRGMTGLREISMPSVKVLQNSDFYQCSNLEVISLPSIEEIKASAFFYAGNKIREIYLSQNLKTFANNNFTYPSFLFYPGSQDDWAAISFGSSVLSNIEKYGTTVVYNYKASTESLTVVSQPTDLTSFKGLPSASTTFEVTIPEGASAYYYWYDETGACVSTSTSPSASFTSSEVGTHTYYCVAKAIGADGTVRTATSNALTLTVADIDNLFEGAGTEESPYLLKTAEDFTTLSTVVNNGVSYEGVVFQMDANITLPADWTPIGATKDGSADIKSGNNLNAFRGTFKGANNTLTVPAGGKPLFNYVWGATIEDLNIYGEQIAGYGLIDKWVGVGLSGVGVTINNVTLKSGTQTLKSGLMGGVPSTNGYACVSAAYVANISNCTVEEGVVIGYDGKESSIGSIAGKMQGTVENCVSYAAVKGTSYVGGIIGTRDNAMGVCSVKNCTFAGDVVATGDQVGGIVGGGYNNSTAPNGARPSIEGCTVTGSVAGRNYVGGIFGSDLYVAQTWDNVVGNISNNTFAGKVSGESYVGGIIGYLDSLNRYDTVSNNQYAHGCGANIGIAYVKYIDTSYDGAATMDGTIVFNTANGTAACPQVTGCGWKADHNRTDDPLGVDANKLAREMTYFEASTVLAGEGATTTVRAGDTVTVDVVVRANDGVAALSGTLDYDPAAFELLSVTKGAGLSESASFLPAEGAAEAAFSFYGNEASAAGEDGLVVATATLKALAASEAATVGVKGGSATLEGDSSDYSVTTGSTASIVVLANALLGDANGSGRVNIVDAQVIYDMSCGRYGESYDALPLPASWTRSTLLWAANVNGDDAIDAADAFATQYFTHYGTWN